MLIEEIDSFDHNHDAEYDYDDYDDMTSVEERITSLQKHYFPPKQTPITHLTLLPKAPSNDERATEMTNQIKWESNPLNWHNCPLAVERLKSLIDSESFLNSKDVTSKLTLMAMQLVECQVNERRLTGMKMVDCIFLKGFREALLKANIHHVYCKNLITNLMLESVDLNFQAIESISFITSIVDEKDKRIILDEVIEKIFDSLYNSRSAEQRIILWTGLKDFIKVLGFSFVRHYHRFFSTCLYCSSEHTDEEMGQMLQCITLACEIAPERASLRTKEIDQINQKVISRGINVDILQEIIKK